MGACVIKDNILPWLNYNYFFLLVAGDFLDEGRLNRLCGNTSHDVKRTKMIKNTH